MTENQRDKDIVFSKNIIEAISRVHNDNMEYKIQRRILIDGVSVNIRARTEQEYADRIVARARNIQRPDTDKVLFALYVKKWYITKPQLAEATAQNYKRQINNYIIPYLGDKFIEDLTATDIQILLNSMGDLGKSSKEKMMMVLKQILDCAVEDRIINLNPAKSKRIKITGAASQTRAPYTVSQMKYIVQNMDNIQNETDKLFIGIISLHPMRLEEVLGLMWSDIDPDNNQIRIQRAVTHPTRNQPVVKDTKTEQSKRIIWLSSIVKDMLPKGNRSGFIFGKDAPLSYTQVRKMCVRIKKDLNFSENITPSRFRPSVISDLYQQTKDIKFVQESAGHATMDTTLKHYINNRKDFSTGAKVIDGLYGK